MNDQLHDRQEVFKPTPRPDWMKTLNELGTGLDINAIVPLTPESLMEQAIANTGLSDFGDDDWLEPFNVLMKSIDSEANFHLAGRLLTRAEFLGYLEVRLQVVDWCRRHSEVEREEIDQPVFITGYGRSGTTILFEVLSQDPQFRVAQRWETDFPVPPPVADTYSTDDRIEKSEHIIRLIQAMSPEHDAKHVSGARLPVESIQHEYPTFVSDIFPILMQVPSYAAYLKNKDFTATFKWQKKILQLLQSRYRGQHWLMKSPSHLRHLEKYLQVFSGMKVILTHRDPIVTADSTVSFLGTLYWQRTDKLWGDGRIGTEVLAPAELRSRQWDAVIDMIEDGRLAKGSYANFYYHRFVVDPIAEVRSIYHQLDMTLTDEAANNMCAYLEARPKGKHGKHVYEKTPGHVAENERHHYQNYQGYFGIPNEV